MAYDKERAAQRPGVPGEQQAHLPGVGFVKACRGLVRQNDARFEQHGPRNGDPLLFPTRQRPYFPGGADVHLFEQAAPAPDQGFRDAPSGEGCGQEHVFQRFQLGEKLEVLKDETDMLPAPAISFVFGQRAGYGRAPAYGSSVRKHKPAHDVEEGAFARSRGAPDADVLAGGHFKVRYVEDRAPPPAFGKGEEDVLKFEPVHTRSLLGSAVTACGSGRPAAGAG